MKGPARNEPFSDLLTDGGDVRRQILQGVTVAHNGLADTAKDFKPRPALTPDCPHTDLRNLLN